jgi:hypothetical protein
MMPHAVKPGVTTAKAVDGPPSVGPAEKVPAVRHRPVDVSAHELFSAPIRTILSEKRSHWNADNKSASLRAWRVGSDEREEHPKPRSSYHEDAFFRTMPARDRLIARPCA